MEKIILEKLNSLEKKLFSNVQYNNMNNNISPLDEGIEQAPLISLDSQTVARKHKKQEKTHFKEFKTQNKSTKKDEKIARDKLKVKIAILADKLFRKNKINKPLHQNYIILVLVLLDYQHYKQHIIIEKNSNTQTQQFRKNILINH